MFGVPVFAVCVLIVIRLGIKAETPESVNGGYISTAKWRYLPAAAKHVDGGGEAAARRLEVWQVGHLQGIIVPPCPSKELGEGVRG